MLIPAQVLNSYLEFCLQESLEQGGFSRGNPGWCPQQRHGSCSLPEAKGTWKNRAEVWVYHVKLPLTDGAVRTSCFGISDLKLLESCLSCGIVENIKFCSNLNQRCYQILTAFP